MEQSASTQTQPFQNRTHLVGSSALNLKAPTTTADPSQLPRIINLSIGPRFGSDHRLRPDSDDSRLHPGKNMLLPVAKNSTGEEKLGRRRCQNISPCTCPFTPGLLQLGTGQLARSNACAAHSCTAFCCTAYSKSPETGFRIAGNDGAPLAPTPSSNNIQIVYIDARHPLWSLPKIHEGDGSSPIYLAGPQAPSVCRDPELRHPSR